MQRSCSFRNNFPHVDELVMEYLLFRGFTQTLQAFSFERKHDRSKGFDPDQIIHQLFEYISNYDIESFLQLWAFLEARFFSHLDGSYSTTIRKLELSLKRCYVVNAIKSGEIDVAINFFKTFADQLNSETSFPGEDSQSSWKQWFILPFIQRPERDAYFTVFFSTEWTQSLITSLRNFLSLIFQNLPLPKILSFHLSQIEEKSLKTQLKVCESECNRLRLHNLRAERRIHKLQNAGKQLHMYLQHLVRQIYGDHFANSKPTVFKQSNTELDEIREKWQVLFRKDETWNDDNDVKRANFSGIDNSSRLENPQLNPHNILNSEIIKHEDVDALKLCDEEIAQEVPSSLPDVVPVAVNDIVSVMEEIEKNDIETGDDVLTVVEPKFVYSGHSSGIICCKYSPCGCYIATGGKDSLICIWSTKYSDDAKIDKLIQKRSTSSFVLSLDWCKLPSASHKSILYGTVDGEIKLWDVETNEIIMAMEMRQTSPQVWDLACNPSTTEFVCILRNRNSYNETVEGEMIVPGNSRITYVNNAGGSLELWNYSSGSFVRSLSYSPKSSCMTSICFNHNGTLLLAGSSNGLIRLFDVRQQQQPLLEWKAHSLQVWEVVFAPDETSILSMGRSSSKNNNIIQWSIGPKELAIGDIPDIIRQYNSPYTSSPSPIKKNISCHYRRRIVFDSTHTYFAVNSFTTENIYEAHIYKFTEVNCVKTLQGHSAPIMALDWHPTESLCATVSWDKSLMIWKPLFPR